MSAPRYTPGPWHVDKTIEGRTVVAADVDSDGGGNTVALLPVARYLSKEHDARLIAAAPEMAEALIIVERLSAKLVGAQFAACEGRHNQNGSCLYCDHSAMLDAARAALKKAGVLP